MNRDALEAFPSPFHPKIAEIYKRLIVDILKATQQFSVLRSLKVHYRGTVTLEVLQGLTSVLVSEGHP